MTPHYPGLRIKRTKLESCVSPPSAQCTTWWASQWRESQPGNWHWPRSRSSRARRRAVGTARVLRPTSSTSPPGWRSATRAASQARRRAASPAQVQTTGLLDDRLTGVEARCRRLRLVGAIARLGRFRGNVRRGAGRLTCTAGSRLPARVRRGSDRLRGHRTGSARFRGNARRGAGRLARGEGVRRHVHGHLEAVSGVARIEAAGQRTLGHQPQRIGTPLRNRGLVAVGGRRGRRHLLQRRLHGAQQHRAHLRGQPRAQQQHAVVVHLRAQQAARQAYLLAIRLRGLVCLPPATHQPLHLRGGGAAGHRQQPRLGGRGSHPRQGRTFE